jgi:hypothetical protein
MKMEKESPRHGVWIVPSRGASYNAHSGIHYVINKWGDTRMGITFPFRVDISGAWFAGQGGDEGVWASGIRVIGFCDNEPVKTTDWFEDIDSSPSWFAMGLIDVDRIVIEAAPVFNGGGWYAMDDLTYIPNFICKELAHSPIVLDFEDCSFKLDLTDLDYGGLNWEIGTGSVYTPMPVLSDVQTYIIDEDEVLASEVYSSDIIESYLVNPPTLVSDFQGVIRGDAESWSYPPDSCGAAGPDHFVEVVNRNFAVYDKYTGEELINILLGSFLPGSNGDPRVLYDQFSERWFIIVCDFSTRIYLAVSTSEDPTEEWFKCSFVVSQGSDAGKSPDYPTLGVDNVGVYTSAYMIGGGSRMSIFALEKAPLIDSNPSLGDIYAFRELPYEGAIQPVHTYGSCSGEYFVSRSSSTAIRLRLLTDLLTNPVLTNLCLVNVPSHASPPDAPALGSNVPLDTVGHRLMNAVYRDGYIWTAHCIGLDGRAASRWYKIDVSARTLDDYGTIQDPEMYYFFPTIMVNANGDAIMGFSGSSSEQYAAAYYTGRYADDPPGEMAEPVILKEGEATYNLIDGYGRNRWGDYSLCSLDPVTETLWTIQEYAHSHNDTDENRWGTWIGELTFNRPPSPPEITGPIGGEVGIEYDFTLLSTDPEDEDVFYYVDWGDGDVTDWVGPFPSEEEEVFSHYWSELGYYEIKAKAKDINDIGGGWSETLNITISNPPTAPIINGPNEGKPDVTYDFGFISTDPDEEDISEYIIDWGDGNLDEYIIGPFSSGQEAFANHTWVVDGEFIITAKAKDINGVEGPETTLPINIPRSKEQKISFWLRLFEFFPTLQRLLDLVLINILN